MERKTRYKADLPTSSLHTLLGMPSAPGALFRGARRIASASSYSEIGGKGIKGLECNKFVISKRLASGGIGKKASRKA